jgi:Prion-inhibition and propagation
MDIYGTAVTAVQQIYQVTVFIQGVVSDIKAFEEDKYNVQLKLELQLASLQFFQQRFLDPQHGLLLPGNLPERVQEAIKHLLEKMKSVLAEYEVLLHRYDLSGEENSLEGNDVVEKEKKKKSFFEKVKRKAKVLKSKGYDWSLFDKDKIIAVVEEYKQWADSLRDMMQHFSQEAVYSLSDAMSNMSLKGTGLEPVAKRQKLASLKAPDDFGSLSGDLEENGTPSDSFQLARWKHDGEEQRVIVEYHDYDSRLKVEDLDPEEIEELKAPVRDLAWLLQNSTFSGEEQPEESDQPIIYALQCLGFIDQVEKERSAFIYKLPLAADAAGDSTASLITLHELINKVDPTTKRLLGKTILGDRFNIAHCLALTLLNVHGSHWIHKNIWSRGILLFQRSSDNDIKPFRPTSNEAVTADSKRGQTLAFLGDWGYARPEQGGTEMKSDFEIEPNLYRHPERQGKPTRQFSRSHDIYALGVVLLEIGLWKTVSQFFDKAIKDAQKTGRLPKAKDVRGAFLTLAQRELPKEVGESYTSAVVACLSSKFKTDSNMELSLDFKERVVDALNVGRKL